MSALLVVPPEARWLLVLGHGAGAGMRHPFLESISLALCKVGVATFRYQFPYMEQGRRGVDSPKKLTATVRSAVAAATETVPGLGLLAGGKSLGGRMTSRAAAESSLPRVQGLVFLGFPLHAPGKVGAERANHLSSVDLPMLFLQGTRDRLANLDLLRPVCHRLGNRAVLHVVAAADHSFRVTKKSGRTDEEILSELTEAIKDWTSRLG